MNSSRRAGAPVAPCSPSPPRKCSLGCPILDSFLKGGIPCGSVTELVGESGSAKTQICLQLLLSAQMPLSHGGLQASSLYIYTEGYFPSKRLQQLARGFLDSGKLVPKKSSSEKSSSARKDFVSRNGVRGDAVIHNVADSHRSFSPRLQQGYGNGKRMPSAATSNAIDSPRTSAGSASVPRTSAGSASVNLTLNHRLTNHDRLGDLIDPQMLSLDDGFEVHTDVYPPKPGESGRSMYDDGELEDPCDNIFVQSIQNIEDLCSFLDQAHLLLSRPLAMPVRVLIVDSVAALFRSDFDNNARDLAMRTEWFFKFSSKLKQYAYDHDIAVLVTNQVVDDIDRESLQSRTSVDAMLSGRHGNLVSANRRLIPALGIGWSHCVNTRLFLSRTYVPDDHRQYNFRQTGQTEVSYGSNSSAFAAINDCSGVISASSSVLEQLESELPDSLLLTVAHQRSATSHKRVDDSSSVAYADATEPYEPSNSKMLQDVHNRRFIFSSNSESLPSCRIRRNLRVVFAPHLAESSCEFVVQEAKICGVLAGFSMQALSEKSM